MAAERGLVSVFGAARGRMVTRRRNARSTIAKKLTQYRTMPHRRVSVSGGKNVTFHGTVAVGVWRPSFPSKSLYVTGSATVGRERGDLAVSGLIKVPASLSASADSSQPCCSLLLAPADALTGDSVGVYYVPPLIGSDAGSPQI